MICKSYGIILLSVLAITSIGTASQAAKRQTQVVCCHSCDDDSLCQVTLGGKISLHNVNGNIRVGVECGDQGLPHVVVCSVTLDPVGYNRVKRIATSPIPY